MGDRILVTGGAGFIGSHLVDRFVAKGFEARVFDNFSTGRRENLAGVADRAEIVEGDLRDPDAVSRAVAGCRFVLHEAALGSVVRSVEDPREAIEVNVLGTVNVLVAARDAGVERVVYASSSSVYGDTPALPKRESARPDPLSPYALSKLSAEQACAIFTRLYGLATVSLRYFNVFGPRQDPASQYAAVIPRFITAIKAGLRPVIYGDGTQTRDFTYVDNVVEANVLALRAPLDAIAAGGGVFNISCGVGTNLLDLAAEINRIAGTDLDPVFEAPRPGDPKHSRAAIDLAERHLGYRPSVALAEGLARAARWYARQAPVAAR